MSDAEPDAVRAANDAFYRAHEERDLDAMAAVWERGPEAVCTHPGWPILRGWDEIAESWRRIFEGPGRNQFLLTNVAVDVRGDAAWVTLEENLMDLDTVVAIAATNVFARSSDGAWSMVAHHASPIMPRLG